MELDMTPTLTPNDVSGLSLLNPVAAREGGVGDAPRRVKGAHLRHIGGGHLGMTIALTSPAESYSPLGDFVGYVVSVGSEKQVGRIAARAVVAAVQDVEAVFNRAVRSFPSVAVGLHKSLPVPQASVATIRRATSPRPTVFGPANPNVVPKMIHQHTAKYSAARSPRQGEWN
jgi:hypothetical protein